MQLGVRMKEVATLSDLSALRATETAVPKTAASYNAATKRPLETQSDTISSQLIPREVINGDWHEFMERCVNCGTQEIS